MSPKCPKCKTDGKLIKDYGRIISYLCPKCGKDWVVLPEKPKRK